jgi:hypothetical protein
MRNLQSDFLVTEDQQIRVRCCNNYGKTKLLHRECPDEFYGNENSEVSNAFARPRLVMTRRLYSAKLGCQRFSPG